MKFSFKERLMLSTVMTGFAASMAVTAPAAVAQEEGIDEIFVTGSRIARKDFTANSPVVTVGQEELDLSGVTNIENLLNSLPAVVPGLNSTSNNPGLGGQATVDLRGLGSSRTLVLINGRRLGPSDKNGTVDLNVIPSTLVERVEVVTGGASAVYGSDALSGVVNFIMKDDFEGAEFGTSYGRSDYEDATERTYDFTLGGNFGNGRGNAVVYGQTFKRDGVLQGARPWSQIAGQDLGGDWGSSRRPGGSLEASILNPFGSNFAVDPRTGHAYTNSRYYIDNGAGDAVDGDGTGLDIGKGLTSGYNFTPVNALILPQNRLTLSGSSHYDINDNVTAFAEFLYSDTQANVQLAATPLTTSSGIRVPWNNEYLNDLTSSSGIPGAGEIIMSRPDPFAPLGIQRRMLEVGERMQFFDKKFTQYTLGFEGVMPEWPLFNGWDYEVSYTKAKSDEYDRLENDLSIKRTQESLDGCLPGSSAGCVKIDFFGAGSITPEQANWLRLKSVIDHHSNSQETLNAFISGSVWELPAGDLQVALGTEYRKDTMNFTPAEASRGDLIGFNGVQPTSGSVDVKEGYIEAVIPILAGYEMAEYLGLEAGYRYSKYSSVGGIRSFKVGAEWQPVSDVRFRVMYQEATRAPNVFELFQAGDENFPSFSDSDACNGAVTGATAEICAWQLGLSLPGDQALVDAYSQSDRQIAAFRFGNEDLFEESSETFTIGAVVTPSFLPWGDLSVSIDYYDIQISDWIGSRGIRTIHDNCFASTSLTEAQADADCALIARQPNGDLRISNPNENVSNVKTTGVDLNAVYSFSMDEFGVDQIPGDFQISALVTYLDSYEFDGSEYKGITYGLSGAYPEWKTNIRTTYNLNDWQLSWQYERIAEMDDYGYSAPGWYPFVEAKAYHNLAARWFVTDQFELIANVNNVADEKPQGTVSGYATGPNVDASNYDVLGRYYRISARLKF